MRIIALGGCGGMGRFAVRTALTFDFIEKIIIADLDEARAREFAAQCGAKAGYARIDIEDSPALKLLFSETDVVMSTVGPYYRLGVPILKAAIESGCDYIDINDDWEPTLEMLDLSDDARDAGVTAVLGVGASPGISNMLALKAMEPLDSVEKLYTGWGVGDTENSDFGEPGRGGSFGAAIEHWVHQFTGKIRVRRDGSFVESAPLEAIEINYPGIGRGTVHTLGHPEPVTLGRFRPEIQDCYNVMDFPPYLISILKNLARKVDSGKMSVKEAADIIESLEGKGFTGILFSSFSLGFLTAVVRQILRPQRSFPGDFALAVGRKDDQETTVAAHLKSLPTGGLERMTMGSITGIPMAIGLKMLADNHISRKGVFAPEEALDPDIFFDELAPLCTPAYNSSKDLVAITGQHT